MPGSNSSSIRTSEPLNRTSPSDAENRNRRQQSALLAMATQQMGEVGTLDKALAFITEQVAAATDVERASVWFVGEEEDELRCADLFERTSKVHSRGLVLRVEDYPAYFEAFFSGRAIDASDAANDPRTCEFKDGYLDRFKITAMLDSAIRMHGKLSGVVCLEHVGSKRIWQADEVAFAGNVADQVAQLLLEEERDKAEIALRKNEKFLRDITANLPGIVYQFCAKSDGKWGVDYWSGGDKAVFDLAEEDFDFFVHFVANVLEEDREEFLRSIQFAVDNVTPWEYEGRFVKRSGEVIWFRGMSTPERRAGDVLFHGILLDITERKRLEEMMVHSEKMLSLGELAAGMAHEINNPLAGVIQSQQVIKARLSTEQQTSRRVAEECGTSMEAVREFLERRSILKMMEAISDSSERAAAIVSNMLSFARKSESHLSSNDLSLLLDRALELVEHDYDLKRKYDFKEIKIVREYENNPPKAHCDANKVVQVFLNILKNGAQAMGGVPQTQRLTAPCRFILRVAGESEMVKVEIEDNGPGMDEVTSRRVFEPFFTTKTTEDGTGLGLSVSYFIVTEEHKGTMSLESHPGWGTKFIIRLPIADHSG